MESREKDEAHQLLRAILLAPPARPFLVRELESEGLVDYVRRRQREDSFLFHNRLLPIKPIGETDGKA